MKPLLLHYYVTYRCNARCGFCGIWRDKRLKGVGSPGLREMARNLRQARGLGARFVDLTGGEPLLYGELAEALNVAKEMGFWTSVTTNCILYPERARELAGRVDLMHFSLDAMDRRTHDALRGVRCYDRVMESIEIAKGLGERPDLLCTVTSEHLDGIEELVRFAQRERLMLILNPVFSYFGNGRLSNEGMEVLLAFARKPYVYLNRAFVALYRRGGNDTARPRCRVLDSTIVLSPDGKLLVPCFHHHVRRIPVNGRLAEAYYAQETERIRMRQGRFDFCEGCTITCYFDPSFHYEVDTLLGLSLWSKAKYGFDKYVRARF